MIIAWWPFSGETTFYIVIGGFGLLYGVLIGIVGWAEQKQKQFRQTEEYREFRSRLDSLK